jgi:hypothetical protein
MSNGWIGVDLDGTLAEYHGWTSMTHIGKPIMPMVDRVKKWLSEFREVRILTARVSGDPITAGQARKAIREWCQEHLGQELKVTCVKDMGMLVLYDDRAVAVEENTGLIAGFRVLDANDPHWQQTRNMTCGKV